MSTVAPLFTDSFLREYFLDDAYDEMFTPDGTIRPQYKLLLDTLRSLPKEELLRRKHSADTSFLTQGITFTVYGKKEGTERIFPNDMLPRIVTSAEWKTIEKGLIQRITALNLFLGDVYHEGKILQNGAVPREIVYSCRHFRREMRGLQVPRNVYIAVTGTDLLRLNDGSFAVLEDNLRVPQRRQLHALQPSRDEACTFPIIFREYGVRPVEHYPQLLLASLRALAPEGRQEPTIVLLTPGRL